MARIHLLETDIPNSPEPGIQQGSIRCIYHVNISSVKIENVDVSEQQVVGNIAGSGRLLSGTVRVGPSSIPSLLSEHPDFTGVTESVALAAQNLAEVEVQIQRNEGETEAAVKGTAADFYSTIEDQAKSLYTQKFDLFSQSTNNLPA